MKCYTFKPILKQTLWGGERIIPMKHLDARLDHVGESWEVSGVEGSESIVAEGEHAGMTLTQLTDLLRDKLVGRDNYQRFGNEFPLLIKFIDAQKDLSIQVHPDDTTARRHGKDHGKSEMWYLMPSAPHARLRSGLRRRITPEEYAEMVANDTICDAIAEYDVKEGDCFYLPAGRIHSIGAGCLLTEIQQTSDVTYRIYDFKRRDKDGNLRQLHTAEAAESIDYRVSDDYRTHYTPAKNQPVELVRCPYFTTTIYDLSEPMSLDYSELDSFVVLICVGGSGTLSIDGEQHAIAVGQTLLLPATCQQAVVSGTVKLIETYV